MFSLLGFGEFIGLLLYHDLCLLMLTYQIQHLHPIAFVDAVNRLEILFIATTDAAQLFNSLLILIHTHAELLELFILEG